VNLVHFVAIFKPQINTNKHN